MKINDLISRTRSIRRFDQQKQISPALLNDLIDLARLGGSARNLQPWKYMICQEPSHCQAIFPHLGWAGYLPNWPGPAVGEQPTAYILCLLDTSISSAADVDLGIASQNLLLAAMAQGIGGCRIASIAKGLSDLLQLPSHLQLKLVIALGYPAEVVTLVDCDKEGSIRYWHGDDRDHFVPKRCLTEILLPLSLAG